MIENAIKLNDGYTASKEFYSRIYKMMAAALLGKASCVKCTVKQFVGKGRWNKLDSGERRLAGRCTAHMVSNGHLPLEFAGKNKSNALLYQLK